MGEYKSTRHEELLVSLNDLFDQELDKNRNDPGPTLKYFSNRKNKENIIKQMSKDNYDRKYLHSIYDDLLYGVSLNYDFGEESKGITVGSVIVAIIVIALAVAIGIMYWFVLVYLCPIVFIISFIFTRHKYK